LMWLYLIMYKICNLNEWVSKLM